MEMSTNLLARNVIFDRFLLSGLLATTFFLPTLFGSLSIVLALILALIAGLRFFASSRIRQAFCWQPTLAALLAVFGVLGLVSALSADEVNDMSFLVSFLGLAFPILLYQYLVALPQPPSVSRIAAYCLIGSLVGLLFAHAQYYGLGIGRTVAIAAGSNAIARVAALLGFLALIGLNPKMRTQSNLVVIAPIAAIGVVVLSGSKGTVIAVPLMLAIALLFALPMLWARSRVLTMFVLVATIVAVAGFVLVDPYGFVSRAINTIVELAAGQLPGNSSELRYQMLVGAWNAFQQSPIIGYGWAGQWDALMQAHPTPEIFAPVKQYFSFHNDIADFAVAGGILGLFAYAILLFAPIVNLLFDQSLQQDRLVAYALVLLPTSYFIFGFTDFIFGFDLLTTLYGFSLAFVLAAAKAHPASAFDKGFVEN